MGLYIYIYITTRNLCGLCTGLVSRGGIVPTGITHNYSRLHLHMKYAFASEYYRNHQPIYVRNFMRAYRTLTYQARAFEHLRLTLYSSKSSRNHYQSGVGRGLFLCQLDPSETIPCLCFHHYSAGASISAMTIYDLHAVL